MIFPLRTRCRRTGRRVAVTDWGKHRNRGGVDDVRLVAPVPTKQRLPFGNRLNQVIDSLFFAP